ncbi:MAG: T9SS type A sorting domain-containing protein [Bacteroidetes bacterium]|nr:T9SS type A sorting domain-containing protein [Bacteroidota bacterium]
MKKVLLVSAAVLALTVVHGQINPIKNLQFSCQYQYPPGWNCWGLSWSPPDSIKTDTLVGYKVYRDTNLYIFTKQTGFYYDPCIGNPDTTYIGFTNYNWGMFYIHVTAVYDTTHIESTYNDSIDNGGCGFIIGVNENNYQQTVSLFPNPFSTSTTLQTNTPLHNATLTVYNCYGQEVKSVVISHQSSVVIERGNLASGIYFYKVTEDKGQGANEVIATGKLIITDK